MVLAWGRVQSPEDAASTERPEQGVEQQCHGEDTHALIGLGTLDLAFGDYNTTLFADNVLVFPLEKN